MIRPTTIARTGILTLFLGTAEPSAAQSSDAEMFFERRIRPALIEHCFECHSADSKRLGGNLRLDSRDAVIRGGDLGAAVVIGAANESLLIQAIEHTDTDLKMPYRRSRLAPSEIDAFKQWIDSGLAWPESSAVAAPSDALNGFDLAERKRRLRWIWERPMPVNPPAVERSDWPMVPLDTFILARLEQQGYEPAPPAKPGVWLRRVTLALTGLPPEPEQITALERDSSPQRFEKAVDSLLASPRFGERWARHWMDLMRYAESRGHESDFAIANAYHYRDYLVRAWNQDLPYDQYIKEHLAGDLVAPRLGAEGRIHESILATGWAFLGEEVHSPVDIRQDECDRIDNKVDVLSKAFLGLTVGCARCHDHKFDAITQQDFYSLAGYFLSADFQQTRFESAPTNARVAKRLDAFRRQAQARVWREASRLLSRETAKDSHAAPVIWPQLQARSAQHIRVSVSDDGLIGARLVGRGLRYLAAGEWYLDSANRLALASRSSVRRDSRWDHLVLTPGNENDSGSLDATSRANGMVKSETFTLESGRLHYLVRGQVKVYAAVDSHIMIAGPLHGHLVRRFDQQEADLPQWVSHDLSEYAGHRVHLEFGAVDDADFELLAVVESESQPENPLRIVSDLGVKPRHEIAAETLRQAGFEWDHIASDQRQKVILAAAERLQAWRSSSVWQQLEASLDRGETRIMEDSIASSKTAVAWSENKGIDEYLLVRGSSRRPKGVAPRRLPIAFGSGAWELPKRGDSVGSGRLELADAVVSEQNPLTARVMVNRVWHHLFGRGLVPTVDNFGFLGERPTHPKLLDHLSYRFIHHHRWSVKALVRSIVLSSTYRQASQPADTASLERDPLNRWLARFPVRRLEAEAIRDSILAVTGSLNTDMFGKSIPVHLTDFVIGRGRPEQSGPRDGNGRRSVYLAVRRNFLPTLMTVFDFPSPFSAVGRRNTTNVPAQALAMMNDAFVHDQAQAWAEQELQRSESKSVSERLPELFLAAFGRRPTSAERVLCERSWEELYKQTGDELQAWQHVCHSLLSMNDFIYVR